MFSLIKILLLLVIVTPNDSGATFSLESSSFSVTLDNTARKLYISFSDWTLRHLWKVRIKVEDSYGRTNVNDFQFRATSDIIASINGPNQHIANTETFFGRRVTDIL
jgi:hypothetical protein